MQTNLINPKTLQFISIMHKPPYVQNISFLSTTSPSSPTLISPLPFLPSPVSAILHRPPQRRLTRIPRTNQYGPQPTSCKTIPPSLSYCYLSPSSPSLTVAHSPARLKTHTRRNHTAPNPICPSFTFCPVVIEALCDTHPRAQYSF